MKAAVTVVALALPAFAHAETYVRAGLAYERSAEASFRDLDCARAAPPALFGCGASAGGGLTTADGRFGSTAAVELGLGRRISPYLRLEGLVTYRPDLDFTGRANFARAPAPQRALADLDSLSALAVAYADLGVYGRLRPFLGLGLGAASNRLGAVRIAGMDAVRGGRRTDLAWMAAAGVSASVSSRLTLDLAWRYADLGKARTGDGPVFAPIQAGLVVQGVSASVRWGF